MEFSLKEAGKYTVINMPEVVNYEANLALKGKIEDLCSVEGRNIAIDLAAVSFIGSLGIGLLSFAKKLVESTGGAFCLLAPNKSVMAVIKRLKLENMFNIYENGNDILA